MPFVMPSDPGLPAAYNRMQALSACLQANRTSPLMPRILCLGMSALDAIYRVPAIPAIPTKVLATAFTECGGGMAANASVAVARLGGQACYWGRLGADLLGERILAQLSVEGVDVAGCAADSGMRFTVRRHPGRRRRRAAGLRV